MDYSGYRDRESRDGHTGETDPVVEVTEVLSKFSHDPVRNRTEWDILA